MRFSSREPTNISVRCSVQNFLNAVTTRPVLTRVCTVVVGYSMTTSTRPMVMSRDTRHWSRSDLK